MDQKRKKSARVQGFFRVICAVYHLGSQEAGVKKDGGQAPILPNVKTQIGKGPLWAMGTQTVKRWNNLKRRRKKNFHTVLSTTLAFM